MIVAPNVDDPVRDGGEESTKPPVVKFHTFVPVFALEQHKYCGLAPLCRQSRRRRWEMSLEETLKSGSSTLSSLYSHRECVNIIIAPNVDDPVGEGGF